MESSSKEIFMKFSSLHMLRTILASGARSGNGNIVLAENKRIVFMQQLDIWMEEVISAMSGDNIAALADNKQNRKEFKFVSWKISAINILMSLKSEIKQRFTANLLFVKIHVAFQPARCTIK